MTEHGVCTSNDNSDRSRRTGITFTPVTRCSLLRMMHEQAPRCDPLNATSRATVREGEAAEASATVANTHLNKGRVVVLERLRLPIFQEDFENIWHERNTGVEGRVDGRSVGPVHEDSLCEADARRIMAQLGLLGCREQG